MRKLIDHAWPLFAAAMEDKKLPNRVKLDTPGKRVLYRLAHPKPLDYDAMLDAKPLTQAQRQLLIDRLQRQADEDAKIFVTGRTCPETRRYISALTAGKRFNILRAYTFPSNTERYLGRTKNVRRPSLSIGQWKVERHRGKWIIDDLFQALWNLDALWKSLTGLTPDELTEGFEKFGATKEEEDTRAAAHAHRALVLATCIAAARRTSSSADAFVTESKLRQEIAAYFATFCEAYQRATVCAKSDAPTKLLIQKSFRELAARRLTF
ncbi:hypothetical protein [Aurantimonas sp. VKM B-3413]|uniref:hypothetical protein n=1 Tax=Aurantimonas sp. VKM B-3413 TaxID=2779401 RepID=UPI001E63CD21|nr:hypothetical protein [Aurantimonas sp. VKM B-3413]MCB8837014.1 hypothetical protein [Aurantimonas sp. VKM B-3413]